MPNLVVEPLPPGCPWSGYTPPNVDWCEEQLCSWIVNPADTWSNLAFVGVGLWMVVAARQRPEHPMLGLFGPAAITTGVFSFAYHASYTYLLQFFDFVGMFLFCFTLVTANALRLGWIGSERRWWLLLGGTAVASAAVPLVGLTAIPIQAMVAVLIALILGQEAAIRHSGSESETRYSAFLLGLALLAAAGLASLADVTRTFCDPTNHWIQGHSVWHVLSAASLYAMYRFYESLAADGHRPRPAG